MPQNTMSNSTRSPRRSRTTLLRLSAYAALFLGMPLSPAPTSTYFPEKVKCPVGGKSFEYMALGSITRWGQLPDGMPLGSGLFPTPPPKCPDNALVMYRDFTPAEVKILDAFIKSDDYRALITSEETTYYLAWRTAKHLGDADAVWLLLQASWEAKNIDPESERAKRYNATSPLISWSGLVTTVLAPFGCYAVNLAAITAALCMGQEIHRGPRTPLPGRNGRRHSDLCRALPSWQPRWPACAGRAAEGA